MDQGLIQAVEATEIASPELRKPEMENGMHKKELPPPPTVSKEEVLFDAAQTERETGS
jgi:hypothetical protein